MLKSARVELYGIFQSVTTNLLASYTADQTLLVWQSYRVACPKGIEP